jgi:nicotinamidase/pyrazinamidase
MKWTKNIALIIVDLLEDFGEGGALAVTGARHIATKVKEISKQYTHRIMVNDFHPDGHCSFKIWPKHCVQGSPGAKFMKELTGVTNGNGDYAVTASFPKGTDLNVDSYSGFLDNDRKKETGLREYLKVNEITHLHIVGVATEYCVRATALDAIACGFDTTVIEDLIAGVDIKPGDAANAIEEMKVTGVKFIKL